MRVKLNSKKIIITKTYRSVHYYLSDKLSFFERTQVYGGNYRNIDVYGNFWVIMIGELMPGQVYIHSCDKKPLVGRILIYIPPFSIIEWEIFALELKWKAMFSWKLKPSFKYKTASAFNLNIEDDEIIDGLLNQDKCIDDFLSSFEFLFEVGKKSIENSISFAIKVKIDRYLGQTKKIEEIAQELNIHSYKLTREFKKAFGLSPVAYRNKARIFESMTKLLGLKNNSVLRTAYEVGFGDLSRFNKEFKKITGATPSQYKNK